MISPTYRLLCVTDCDQQIRNANLQDRFQMKNQLSYLLSSLKEAGFNPPANKGRSRQTTNSKFISFLMKKY
jgi:hypothetical protein